MRALCLTLLLLSAGTWYAAEAEGLRPEHLLQGADIDTITGLRLSPGGELAVIDLSSGGESLTYDFPTQMYSSTGYPMWASLSIYRAHVLNLRDGELSPLASGPGISWGGSWSPNGQMYAFYSDRTGEPGLWIWERETGNIRQLTGPVARSWGPLHPPRWTPDGKRILYKAVPEGVTRHDLDMFNEEYRRWKADGSAITQDPNAVDVIVKASFADQLAEKFAVRSGAEAEHLNGPEGVSSHLLHRYLSDLVTVDVTSGEVVQVASRSVALTYDLSPDGRWVAALEPLARRSSARGLLLALRIYPTTGGAGRTLVDEIGHIDGAYVSFRWSPQGDRIAYVSREGVRNDIRVYVVTLDGSRTEASKPLGGAGLEVRNTPVWSDDGKYFYAVDVATEGFSTGDVPVGRLLQFTADGRGARKLVDVDGRAVRTIALSSNRPDVWSPDRGRSLYVVAHDQETAKNGLFRVDVATGALASLAEFDATIHGNVVATKGRAAELLFVREDIGSPSDLWALDVRSGRTRQVTRLHPTVEGKPMGTSRLIHWTSERGEPLKGALLLPPNYRPGMRYPLMVQIYGGSYGSHSVNKFGLISDLPQFNAQLYAAHGYAVLYPDIPLHEFTPLKDYASAVLPALDKVIELGIADPEKLAVAGQSFGGYGTLALLVQTTRFKAAIATNSGASNLFAAYPRPDGYWMQYYEIGQSRMGGTPWEQHQRYLENSPFFSFHKIKTPVLIQRGDGDPISEDSGSVFTSLERLGQEVLFLEYAQEGHVLQRPQHILDFWRRQYDFLDRYIDPTPRVDGS